MLREEQIRSVKTELCLRVLGIALNWVYELSSRFGSEIIHCIRFCFTHHYMYSKQFKGSLDSTLLHRIVEIHILQVKIIFRFKFFSLQLG